MYFYALFIVATCYLGGSASAAAAPTSITTVPGQYTWSNALQSTTPGFIALDFTATNSPGVTENSDLIIALSEQSNAAPAYAITLSYTKSTDAYSLFAVKRVGATPLQTRTILASDQPSVRAYLDAWRNGTPQPFSLIYNDGSMLLLGQNVLLWSWQDDAPIQDVCRASFSSTTTAQTCSALTCASSLPASVNPNTAIRVPLGTAATVITFKTTALPSTLNIDLFANAANTEATYALLFDTTSGIHTQLSHKTPGTATSAIPDTTGSYDVASALIPAAAQTYFMAIAPRSDGTLIAFGLLVDNASPRTLMSWVNPKQPAESMQFCALRANVTLTDLKSARLSFDIPALSTALGLTKLGDSYIATALNQSAAYKNDSTTWQESFSFPSADAALLQCDVSLTDETKVAQNGAVVLFGTQPQGEATCGLIMEPAADQNAPYGSSALRARFRLVNITAGTFVALGNPVTVDGHTLKGTYQILYQASGTDTPAVTIWQGAGATKKLLATLPLNGTPRGIRCATLSAQRAPVTYRAVTISAPLPENTTAAAPSSSTTVDDPFDLISDGFDTLTRNKIKTPTLALDFNWNHFALQQVVEQTNGFSLETTIIFRKTASERTIVIGLSPATIDQSKCYYFNIGGQQVDAAFSGATQLVMLSLNKEELLCMRCVPSPKGTSSPIVSQKKVAQSFAGTSHRLWLTYTKTTTTHSVAFGIDTPVGQNPLFGWSDTRIDTTTDYAKIGLSSWFQTDVAYQSILLKSVTPTPTATATNPPAGNTKPNTLTRTPAATDPYGWDLKYDWTLGKKEQNAAGTLDATYGGAISALIQITALDKDQKATLMIGFSPDPTTSQKMQEGGQPAFPGALYNIQLQAKSDNGYISLRRPTTSVSSPFEAATFAPVLTGLLTKEGAGTNYPIKKIWARYSPSGGQRLFEAGLVAADDTRAIADISEVLWSWTETNVPADQAPLLYAGISSWNTACQLSEITVTPATAAAGNAMGGASVGQKARGTLTAAGLPTETQWTLNAFCVKPGTQHTITLSGAETDEAVIAFSPNAPASTGVLCSALISKTGINLRDAENKIVSTSTQGALSSVGASYLIRANTSTISISLKGSTASTETTLVSWTHDALKAATECWYAAYGTTETSSALYEGGVVSTGNASSPVMLAPVIRNSRPGAERVALSTRAGAARPAVLSSAELAHQQYRVNKPSVALAAAPR